LSWRDILKDAKTISQTSGSFDFESEEIPEQDKKDCVKELKEYYDKAKNHPKSSKSSNFKFSPIPEEVACEIVERIKSIKKSGDLMGYRRKFVNNTAYYYVVRYGVFERQNGEKYQKFRVLCYDVKPSEDATKVVRFSTMSHDLNDDIDFR
tara:strand:+ start:1605 stop:2057 length:453 start_codon:yes stop_codon:yes gene_type:complete